MKKTRIALISVPGADRWMGGVNYIKSIVQLLANASTEIRSNLWVSLIMYERKEEKIYEDIFPLLDAHYYRSEHFESFSISNKIKWKVKQALYGEINPRLISFLKKEKIDFVYSDILSKRKNFKIQSAKWLPDFQFLQYPEGSSFEDRKERIKEFDFAAKYAQKIVVSSYDVKEQCKQYLPKGYPKINVFRFCAFLPSNFFAYNPIEVVNQYHLPKKYFIISNLFAPTKNHIAVLKALALLKQKNTEVKVVCTGNLHDYRNPFFINEIQHQISLSGLYNNVFLLGNIKRIDQVQLFRYAHAVIQPSKYEGWNTGVEEAKMLGKKLVISDLAIHQEQAPSTATYFNADDEQELANKLETVWNDDSLCFDREKEVQNINNYSSQVNESRTEFLSIITH